MAILVVTNGSSGVGAIRSAGIAADFCAWNDVLPDGPVPSGADAEKLAQVRARFIADLGWAEHQAVLTWFTERDAQIAAAPNFDEVVLWFEHDLYDQLQLIQVLDRLSELKAPVSLIQQPRFIAESPPSMLVDDFGRRKRVDGDQYTCASLAWAAFRSATPTAMVGMVASGRTSPLPFLAGALERWFVSFPDVDAGLTRTERMAMELVRDGTQPATELFRACNAMEAAAFRGDWSFWELLRTLTVGDAPLLETDSGEAFDPERAADSSLFLTEAGGAVLDGKSDRIDMIGIDAWRGGVRLTADDHWRYSSTTGFVRQRNSDRA